MAKRTGSADLPLHGGRGPAWLATRMSSLGAVVTQAIVHHYGRDEFLRRLSYPFWFQSFGAMMGMDWHSSGITTSAIGALKRGLGPLQDELGIHVCGGRGQHSRKTPDELRALGDRVGVDALALTQASRLVARIDSAAVQDGFDLYLHGFFVTNDGRWTVAQQGMNGDSKQARRYHLHSESVKSFVDAPHSAIDTAAAGRSRQSDRPARCTVAERSTRPAGVAGRRRHRGRIRRVDGQPGRAAAAAASDHAKLERMASGPSLKEFVDGEHEASASLGGRSVFGWEEDRHDPLAAAK